MFPNYIKRWWGKKEDGWEDLGKTGIFINPKTGGSVAIVCGFCSRRTNIIRDSDGEVKRVCLRCLYEILDPTK